MTERVNDRPVLTLELFSHWNRTFDFSDCRPPTDKGCRDCLPVTEKRIFVQTRHGEVGTVSAENHVTNHNQLTKYKNPE